MSSWKEKSTEVKINVHDEKKSQHTSLGSLSLQMEAFDERLTSAESKIEALINGPPPPVIAKKTGGVHHPNNINPNARAATGTCHSISADHKIEKKHVSNFQTTTTTNYSDSRQFRKDMYKLDSEYTSCLFVCVGMFVASIPLVYGIIDGIKDIKHPKVPGDYPYSVFWLILCIVLILVIVIIAIQFVFVARKIDRQRKKIANSTTAATKDDATQQPPKV